MTNMDHYSSNEETDHKYKRPRGHLRMRIRVERVFLREKHLVRGPDGEAKNRISSRGILKVGNLSND